MRVATWNVNGLRARLELVLLWLKERQPDVVGLQELKMADEQFPHAELAAAGYRVLAYGQKAWNGVAVLTREPATLIERGLPGQDDFGSRWITARIGDFAFTTLYCPNGKDVNHEDYPRKLAWLDSAIAHLGRSPEALRSGIICGDFNVCPSELDTWDEGLLHGTIFHTDAERARLARLDELGLRDAFRRLHPATRAFSWWDYRGGSFPRNHGLRIDLILVADPLLARVRSVEIDRDFRKKQGELTPSDHAPVVLELQS
jgi:exodeoxyribonuclease-3